MAINLHKKPTMAQTLFPSACIVSNVNGDRIRDIRARARTKLIVTPPTCPKRREAVFAGFFGLQLSIATSAQALIPANDDDDEE